MIKKALACLIAAMMVLSLAACAPAAAPAPAAPAEGTPAKETAKPVTLEKEMEPYYVTADWLKANKDKVVLVDASTDKTYAAGHIPGAVNITWQALSNMKVKQGERNWGVVLGADELGKTLGSFGIDGSKQVIIYNDPKGMGEEGRDLWMLHVAGITNAKMLYGGMPAWKAIGGETNTDSVKPTPVDFKIAKYDDSFLATLEYVKDNQKTLKIIDTRSPEEFNGTMNHGENFKGTKVLGHIPGALHLNYQDLYNVDGTPKSIADMTKIFTDLGLKKDDQIVTYCTVGIRSGFTAEMLHMCGFSTAKNFNGSFSEWAGAGYPGEK